MSVARRTLAARTLARRGLQVGTRTTARGLRCAFLFGRRYGIVVGVKRFPRAVWSVRLSDLARGGSLAVSLGRLFVTVAAGRV